MEQFRAHVKILSVIKKTSDELILNSLPLMQAIETIDNEYVSSLVEEIPELDPKQALYVLQEICLEWVQDAERVNEEIDEFIVSNEDSFKVNLDKCPFLAEVWNGDAYDKSGIDGLSELLADLKKQLGNANEEFLIKTAKERLLGEEISD